MGATIAGDGPDRPTRLKRMKHLVALLVVLGGVRLLFPGDVPFINDEALLFQAALDANEAGAPVSAGLIGTRGIRYGPLPTWFYQTALLVTSDPRWIALVRTALVTALTALALVLLALRQDELSPTLGAFAFVSPYLWFYSRDLWDNSFAIPLTAMLLAAYTQFTSDGKLRWLAVTSLFGTLSFLTHLMTLPLVAAVALHFGATRWRTLVASPRLAAGVGAILAASGLLASPYLGEVLGRSAAGFRWLPDVDLVAFALNGWRLFSLAGFDYFIGPWHLGGLGPPLRLLSLFSYAAGAYGVVDVVLRARDPDRTVSPVEAVSLIALVLFVVIGNGVGLIGHPHYYNGVWIAFFCFWWIGMSRLAERRWARRIFLAQGAATALFLVGLAGWIHANRGARALQYGPTLENQMAVARELELLGAEDAPPSAVPGPRLFPHAIRVLRRLEARGTGSQPRLGADPARVEIVYADPDGTSGAIAVRARAPDESLAGSPPSR